MAQYGDISQSQLGNSQDMSVTGGVFAFDADSDDDNPRRLPEPRSRNDLSAASSSLDFRLVATVAPQIILVR